MERGRAECGPEPTYWPAGGWGYLRMIIRRVCDAPSRLEAVGIDAARHPLPACIVAVPLDLVPAADRHPVDEGAHGAPGHVIDREAGARGARPARRQSRSPD